MNLPGHLTSAIQPLPVEASLCIAYSGGADSTVLLHAFAHLPQARTRGLRALHVDHGLHADSARWAEHCKRFCESLDVPIEIERVQVEHERGEGLEAAARSARHAAFARNLRTGEWLGLAHHRDDQVETVLLKLLRGAGPHGLSGMRAQRPLAAGTLWRPLLDVAHATLREYLIAHALEFVEDPSNADTRLSRNYLRAEILPRLHAHWPHVAQSILHSAKLSRESADHLDALVDSALRSLVRQDGTLEAIGWSALPDALRTLVLERWLHAQDLPAPTQSQAAELRRQVIEAREDHVPRIAWHGTEVRVWRDALHAMAPLPEAAANWICAWRGEPLQLPGGGMLTFGDGTDASGSCTLPPLRVRFRQGGERIKPAGDAHTRELRDLLQHAGIPPWQRGRIPLIFRGEELLAVADLWTSAAGRTFFEEAGGSPRWQRAIASIPAVG